MLVMRLVLLTARCFHCLPLQLLRRRTFPLWQEGYNIRNVFEKHWCHEGQTQCNPATVASDVFCIPQAQRVTPGMHAAGDVCQWQVSSQLLIETGQPCN